MSDLRPSEDGVPYGPLVRRPATDGLAEEFSRASRVAGGRQGLAGLPRLGHVGHLRVYVFYFHLFGAVYRGAG